VTNSREWHHYSDVIVLTVDMDDATVNNDGFDSLGIAEGVVTTLLALGYGAHSNQAMLGAGTEAAIYC
jgi:hypothetical protein